MSESEMKNFVLDEIMKSLEIVQENFPGAIRSEVLDLIEKEIKNGTPIDELAKSLEVTFPPEASIQVQYPAKFISDTSELRRKLPKIQVNGEKHSVYKMGVNVVLQAIDDDRITLSENITEFDLLVYSAICTWIDRGIGANEHDIAPDQRFFTPGIIYKCFNPAAAQANYITENSPEVEEVRKSIDKLRHIKIYLNYSGFIEMDKHSSKAEKAERLRVYAEATKEGLFVNADKKTISVNGQTLFGYELNVVPLMYWQSKKLVKQLATYERRLLVTPKLYDTSRNSELSVLKTNILDHIDTLKRHPRLSRKIKYETIFNRCGIVVKDKHERKRKRDQIKKYLDFLIEQGEIKGYKEYKEGCTLIGIEFIF